MIDPDLGLAIVGYAPYAEMREDWYRAQAPEDPREADPLRVVEMYADVPGSSAPTDEPIFSFPLLPTIPAERVRTNEAIAVEATRGMPETRWEDLGVEIPQNGDAGPILHALIIEIPGQGYRGVVPVSQGQTLALGETGWSLTVDQLAPEPPFPIITEGYEDATSSVAIMTIEKPGDAPPVTRWAFHRFPELNQDLTPGAGGRPNRSAPDPAIRVSYLDLSRLQVYIDEPIGGRARAIVRQPASGAVEVLDPLPEEGLLDIVPNDDNARIDLRPALSWEHAERVRFPVPVPEIEQDRSLVGSHQEAFVAVRATEGAWSETVWIPFAQYLGIDEQHVTITRPDGSPLMLGFGRAQRPFPGFSVALVDFEMIAYDHRGSPRDYQSLVRVAPARSAMFPNPPEFEPYEHVVKLNAPLRAPFHWDPRALVALELARAPARRDEPQPVQALAVRVGPRGVEPVPGARGPGAARRAAGELHDPGGGQQPRDPCDRLRVGPDQSRDPLGVLPQAVDGPARARSARRGPPGRAGASKPTAARADPEHEHETHEALQESAT